MIFIITDRALNGGGAGIGFFKVFFDCVVDFLADLRCFVRAGGVHVGVGRAEHVEEAAALAVEGAAQRADLQREPGGAEVQL